MPMLSEAQNDFLSSLGFQSRQEQGGDCHLKNIQKDVFASVLRPEKQGNFFCLFLSVMEGDDSSEMMYKCRGHIQSRFLLVPFSV